MVKHGYGARGSKRSLTYNSWNAMVQRTTNFGNKDFLHYAEFANPLFLGVGGFERFLAAVGERPSRDHTLDRIDNTKGYVEGNIRWAKKSAQAKNKSWKTYYGRTTEDWARVLGIRPTTVRKRLERGWSHARAFPVHLRLEGGGANQLEIA